MMKSSFTCLFLVALSFSCYAEQANAESHQSESAADAASTSTHAGQADRVRFQAGMLYYRDPETGQLTSVPPALMRGLQTDEINFSDQGLEVEVMPDGSRMVDLQGRFQMSSTFQHSKQGPVFQCTSHPHHHLATPHVPSEQTERAVR